MSCHWVHQINYFAKSSEWSTLKASTSLLRFQALLPNSNLSLSAWFRKGHTCMVWWKKLAARSPANHNNVWAVLPCISLSQKLHKNIWPALAWDQHPVVAGALQWLMLRRRVTWVAHYLDDYIMLGPPRSSVCQNLDMMPISWCHETVR